MNREILFRGKRVDNSEWVYGNFVKDGKPDMREFYIQTIPTFDETFGVLYEVNHNTIGQFTGKYDKNGKKIFEGDILCEGFNPIYQSVKTSTVCFEDGSFYFKYRNNDELSFVLNEWNASQREVIGNIHDNPELLGE